MKKINLVDFLRTIRKGRTYYLKIDTMEIVNPHKYIERQIKDFDKMTLEEKNNLIFPSYEELNIYELPSYEEINHIEIMRFYVKNCIIDTKIRKELFDTLRNHDYIDKFNNTLKKYNLYEEYMEFSYGYYDSIIKEWLDKNNIKLNR